MFVMRPVIGRFVELGLGHKIQHNLPTEQFDGQFFYLKTPFSLCITVQKRPIIAVYVSLSMSAVSLVVDCIY